MVSRSELSVRMPSKSCSEMETDSPEEPHTCLNQLFALVIILKLLTAVLMMSFGLRRKGDRRKRRRGGSKRNPLKRFVVATLEGESATLRLLATLRFLINLRSLLLKVKVMVLSVLVVKFHLLLRYHWPLLRPLQHLLVLPNLQLGLFPLR